MPTRSPDVHFGFTISAVSTPDVGHTKYLRLFRDGVHSRLRGIPFSSSLDGVVFFPSICDPEIIVRPDYVSYKRKESAVFVSVNIPYRTWMAASPFERIDLLAANLKTSVERISPKRLKEHDRCTLLDAIEQTRVELHTSILKD